MPVNILGIESSCDDTSAAVITDGMLKSNIIASQKVHEAFGGVVPELASRSHIKNILPVVSEALKEAGIKASDLSAIAVTRGPGLPGSLHVGNSFAKGMATGLDIPLIDVNHLHAHILSPFIKKGKDDITPDFPYLCLLVSGGNSQIVLAQNFREMKILGKTIDDAAGEAFDKCAKIMGLPYPGGPHIDRLAQKGNPDSFKFAKPNIPGLDYSFSGLKTSFLYNLRDRLAEDPDFIKNNIDDLSASLQKTIIEILISKLDKAFELYPVKHISIGGGVSANSGMRNEIKRFCEEKGVTAWIPERIFTTDNAAMVATAGYFKFLEGEFCDLSAPPFSKVCV